MSIPNEPADIVEVRAKLRQETLAKLKALAADRGVKPADVMSEAVSLLYDVDKQRQAGAKHIEVQSTG